ncbi:site-specific integrase [Hymenobacter sp. M29]|uniref:Site-specific integrase n=1 Tax=Hymenobacter mellowenesis TaxID=3063995 RepID=A0ABT9AKC4_9BACT|nr:site-specific integrase [Hymenobacter sp. M29]MDO7849932.1 site-specific integrase [Hymenobacter sp. M29]
MLRPARASDGLSPVAVRITKDRLPAFANTGVFIAAKDWNEKASYEKPQWIRSSHRDHGLYNKTILNLLTAARLLALESPQLSAADIRDQITGRSAPAAEAEAEAERENDFLEYFEKDRLRHVASGNPRTADKRRSILRKLRQFAGGESARLPFSALTVTWVKDYQSYLLTTHRNAAPTSNKELQVIHTVLKQAIADGLLEFHKDPFLHVRLKHPKTKKARLNVAEVEALAAAAVNPNTWEQYARDCWLLQFNCQGSRVGDILELRHRHRADGRLTFPERKTGKTKNIPIHAALEELLNRYPNTAGSPDAYILPFLDYTKPYAQPAPADPEQAQKQLSKLLDMIETGTALVNRYVKIVAKRAGIEKPITSHVARHSFADAARVMLGGNIKAIQEMLNHGQLRTTEIYMSDLSESELDVATLSVYNTRTTFSEHPPTADVQ